MMLSIVMLKIFLKKIYAEEISCEVKGIRVQQQINSSIDQNVFTCCAVIHTSPITWLNMRLQFCMLHRVSSLSDHFPEYQQVPLCLRCNSVHICWCAHHYYDRSIHLRCFFIPCEKLQGQVALIRLLISSDFVDILSKLRSSGTWSPPWNTACFFVTSTFPDRATPARANCNFPFGSRFVLVLVQAAV